MKNFIKNVFGGLQPSYLIRQYIFGLAFYILIFYVGFNTMKPTMIVFLTISLLLYPFAMFVYDSIIDLLLGNRIIFSGALISIIWTAIKIVFIFGFTIIIAPFGMLYLHFRALKNN